MGTRELSVSAKELIAEIQARRDAIREPPEGAITVRQFADEMNISQRRARQILSEEAESGFLTKSMWIDSTGKRCNIYWRADGRGRK
jgi:hypothetical protein